MTDTDTRIDDITHRLTAVTQVLPPPWTYCHRQPRMSGPDWGLYLDGKPGIRAGVIEYQHGSGLADFITHAPTDIRFLLHMLAIGSTSELDAAAQAYKQGYAAGRKAAAADIDRATDTAIARYCKTRAHDDDVVADTLELAARIAARRGEETP